MRHLWRCLVICYLILHPVCQTSYKLGLHRVYVGAAHYLTSCTHIIVGVAGKSALRDMYVFWWLQCLNLVIIGYQVISEKASLSSVCVTQQKNALLLSTYSVYGWLLASWAQQLLFKLLTWVINSISLACLLLIILHGFCNVYLDAAYN